MPSMKQPPPGPRSSPPPARNTLPRLIDEIGTRTDEPGIRDAVITWWLRDRLGALSFAEQRRIVLSLFTEPRPQERLAGVFALSEILIERLGPSDVDRLAELFTAGHIEDEALTDALATNVLARMIEVAPDPEVIATAIGAWRDSDNVWQQRAAERALRDYGAK
jgi:hypothetical protein